MLDDTSTAYLNAITRGDTSEVDTLARVLDTATLLEQASRNNTPLVAAAHGYAVAAVPVFPIQPRGKRPLTAHGFKDATTDHAVIDTWWTQWPDANIGIPTGHVFDVVDIDGREGITTMYTGTNPIINTLTVLGVALTSRDGGRHLYVPVSGRGNKAAVYPGVDYRGQGGYVVAPPSIGANSRRYTWTQTLRAATAAAA